MKVLDLQAIADVARTRGITTVIDGTWATPLFQKPLEHGIDVVVHSLTKYVGGHSDILGGAAIGSTAFVRDLFYAGFQLQGSVMSALEASLVLRGCGACRCGWPSTSATRSASSTTSAPAPRSPPSTTPTPTCPPTTACATNS